MTPKLPSNSPPLQLGVPILSESVVHPCDASSSSAATAGGAFSVNVATAVKSTSRVSTREKAMDPSDWTLAAKFPCSVREPFGAAIGWLDEDDAHVPSS